LGTAAPFYPRLGDLAHDTTKDGAIGVVVGLPGEDRKTYALSPPGGGEEWSAPADGSTLRPVPAQITHITPQQRDVTYDRRAQQGALPVTAHYEDGGTFDTFMILTPAQMELYAYQVGRLLEQRDEARGGKL
jgi:hypothetical protein